MKKKVIELVFNDQGGCELRASNNDDDVVYAHYYTLDELGGLAEDIKSLPANPTQADFEARAGNESYELGYTDGGIYRDEEDLDMRCGAREVWKLTDFLSHVPEHEGALIFSLLWRVAALELATDEKLAAYEEEERGSVLPFAAPINTQ